MLAMNSKSSCFFLLSGMTVLVSPYLMHRDPAAWQQPLQFHPQRWAQWQEAADARASEDASAGAAASVLPGPGASPDAEPGKRAKKRGLLSGMGPNGSYLPFGAGPRHCIGTGFAMTETQLILALLLTRFTIEPAWPSAELPPADPRITLRPSTVPVRLALRACIEATNY